MDEDTNGIIAVCTVIFDLDKGQTVEYLYPPESLTEYECQRVAFHALPVSAVYVWMGEKPLFIIKRDR